ncbi:DUF6139 family protein [Rugamonas sp.]|uniref:DUF6139 family protein n=1 Tax=Rugamonas sp. TaxID=1926287 RepID=UPI0025EBE064|nr:DUF6139 family protein [Rugamonas sp.]
MRVDIYRRAEAHGAFFFLAVPEGKPIPEEVTNTDWQPEAQRVEMDEQAGTLPAYHIEHGIDQIGSKGYAITALKDI